MKNVLLSAMLVVAGVAGVLPASSAQADDFDYNNYYECLGGICVGQTVRVVSGHWAGHAGAVVGVNSYDNTLTVINSSGYYLYPSLHEVQLQYAAPTGCYSSVCIGDVVRVSNGPYYNQTGRVVAVDGYSNTVTLLVGNINYITINMYDAQVISRGTYPIPVPRPVPVPINRCPAGTVYDTYRGICVSVYPRPVPRPVPGPHPYPGPRPVPGPIVRPVPGRPVPPPVVRPVPGRPTPGRPVPGAPVRRCPPGMRC